MQGYKTYFGIVLTLLGTLGVFEKFGVSQEQVTQFMDLAIQLIGAGIALYGNYDAHRRLNNSQSFINSLPIKNTVSYGQGTTLNQ